MKINRIGVILLFCLACSHISASESRPIPKSWQPDSHAVYDLLVAQMKSSSADFGGSVDALVKYAKSQKDENLYMQAYTGLLRTGRYPEAVKLIKDWQSESKLELGQYHVLALVLNDEIDLAVNLIEKSVEKTDSEEVDSVLLGYLRALLTHWYNPNVLAVFSQLYENYDDSSLLAMALVKQLRWHDKAERAIEVLDKALFSDPKNLSLLQEKSDTYRYSMQLELADNVWQNILKDYPGEASFQFAYARFLFDRYEFVAADQLLAKITPKSDQQKNVDLLQAMTKIQLGDFTAAKTVISWGSLDEQEKNQMHYDIGDLLLSANQPQLAETEFAAIDTKDETEHLALLAALKIGQIKYMSSIKNGDQWFDRLRDEFELSETELTREKANAMQAAEQDKAAYQLLSDYLAANPNNDDMRYLRGLVAADMHKVKIAAEDLGIVYARSADNSDFQNAFGYTLLSTADGDAEKLKSAEKLIKKALFVQPDSPAVVDSMGWLLYQQKSYADSLLYLRFAYANYTEGEIIGHYVAALEKSGQHALAKKIYQLEIKYKPNQEKMNEYTKTIKEKLLP